MSNYNKRNYPLNVFSGKGEFEGENLIFFKKMGFSLSQKISHKTKIGFSLSQKISHKTKMGFSLSQKISHKTKMGFSPSQNNITFYNEAHMFTLIAKEMLLSVKQIETVVQLLDEGSTVPFIARYRKESTGSLDEVVIANIRDRHIALVELGKRREAILSSLGERDLLTDELSIAVKNASSMTLLEDIYLPYRPKRRTRATMARERGLAPLAKWLMASINIPNANPSLEAEKFIQIVEKTQTKDSIDKNVPDSAAALAGARDIIAEEINENSVTRQEIRTIFAKDGILSCKVISGKEAEGIKFQDYFTYEEQVSRIPSHRILAVLRGEEEGFLRVSLRPQNEEIAEKSMERALKLNTSPASLEVRKAAQDAYQRLLAPSLETELRTVLKKRADTEAIRIFSDNIRELLLAPPLGSKSIMGVDPGFRTGCKVACCNAEGKLLEYAVINPHTGSDAARIEAEKTMLKLIKNNHIEAVAVGNGTAGRETETFLKNIANWDKSVAIIMVSESGASVYSASEVARTEFPDLDLTYRGAVSIARRLADPLAELVKIDPKSIGVGQYQHDVHQGELKKGLDDTVMHCVNAVGVDINTASEQLLAYVSGLGPILAKNIVNHRHENGPFTNRKKLLKVARLGAKAFEQCSGFLRIQDGNQPLDASAVHPESYPIVEKMASDSAVSVQELMKNSTLRASIKLSQYVTETIGLPTLTDIMAELEKPGRDPRPAFALFSYTDGIADIKDLSKGMRVNGIITNVTAFGAFVDIGVHQDGLVHVSQLADHFVKNTADVARTGQYVSVTVVDVDVDRKRISLSMKSGD